MQEKEVIWVQIGNNDLNYVDDCPIKIKQWKGGPKKGQYFANAEYDCPKCKFCQKIDFKERLAGDGVSYYQTPFPQTIHCSAKK